MYLIERLLGISTYTIILLFVCLSISKTKKENVKKVLNVYIFALVIMAYFFVPPPGEDLYRIIPTMKIYGAQKTLDFILTLGKKSTPLGALYYHIIGKFNLTGLLPAITALITYSNVFYIIKDFSNRYEIDNKDISKTIFYIMSVGFYVTTISNIRTLLAFSILAVAIYKEYFKSQSMIKSIPWYIVAFLIHASSIIIIVLRFGALILFENKAKYTKKIFFIGAFIVLILNFKNYFNLAIEKFIAYYTEGTFFLIWEFIKITILIVYILYLIRYYHKLKKLNLDNQNISKVSKLLLLVMIFVLIMHKEFNIYLRISYFCSILAIPIVLYNLKTTKENKLVNSNFNKITLFCSVLMLLISATRGHLSSLKFFDLTK